MAQDKTVETPQQSFWQIDIAKYAWGKALKWTAVGVLGLVIVYGIFGMAIPKAFGWQPVLGPSMEPTLPYIGGYGKVKQIKSLNELEVNDIVLLDWNSPLKLSVKRVTDIDPKKGVFVRGDNIDRSADSSFGTDQDNPNKQVWIGLDQIKGKVVDIWSTKRMLRFFTPVGEKINELEFSFPPESVIIADDHIIICQGGKIKFYTLLPTGEMRLLKEVSGRKPFFQKEGRIYFHRPDKSGRWVFLFSDSGISRESHPDLSKEQKSLLLAKVKTPQGFICLGEKLISIYGKKTERNIKTPEQTDAIMVSNKGAGNSTIKIGDKVYNVGQNTIIDLADEAEGIKIEIQAPEIGNFIVVKFLKKKQQRLTLLGQ